jgi:hypothetical protein
MSFSRIGGSTDERFVRVKERAAPEKAEEDRAVAVEKPLNWPSFRGAFATGVADGQHPPTVWDGEKGVNVRWKAPIPGLGHSCPGRLGRPHLSHDDRKQRQGVA